MHCSQYLLSLRQAQRRAKASGKAQAAKKANRAAAEENEALRSIIAEMQEADGAAREQIEALAAVNAELNIQLKQSASREIEWRCDKFNTNGNSLCDVCIFSLQIGRLIRN